MPQAEISGVAGDDDAARISVTGLEDEPGVAFRLFNILAKKNINIDIILQSVGQNGRERHFIHGKRRRCGAGGKYDQRASAAGILYRCTDATTDVAKVSIIGSGLIGHSPGMAARMFEALYEVGVNIRMISTSEIRVTVVMRPG